LNENIVVSASVSVGVIVGGRLFGFPIVIVGGGVVVVVVLKIPNKKKPNNLTLLRHLI
jgi:hypothetical protein